MRHIRFGTPLLWCIYRFGGLSIRPPFACGLIPPCPHHPRMRTNGFTDSVQADGLLRLSMKLRYSLTSNLSSFDHDPISSRSLGKTKSTLVKTLMVSYILAMSVALPVTLLPVYLLYKVGIVGRVQKEKLSLQIAQYCSRWMMRIFPFANKRVIVDEDDESYKNSQPSIWVCNHISLLDIFFVLALDRKMRGKKRRPIKILYWKGLESNVVTRILFSMCGFIPVDMADNGNGNVNEYDPKSFKQMLKLTKEAINDGFDIGLLPEGQPNPTPNKGLQPIFTGAFTLAKMSRRPIQMIGLYGLNHLWNPNAAIGMKCTARDMVVRVYPGGRMYKEAEEFKSTFDAVVGFFGAHGRDMPQHELDQWLDGTMWQTELARRAAIVINADINEAKTDESFVGIDQSATITGVLEVNRFDKN